MGHSKGSGGLYVTEGRCSLKRGEMLASEKRMGVFRRRGVREKNVPLLSARRWGFACVTRQEGGEGRRETTVGEGWIRDEGWGERRSCRPRRRRRMPRRRVNSARRR